MLKHLIYKEWVKTRWAALGGLLLGFGLVVYLYFEVKTGVRLGGSWNFLRGILFADQPNYFWGRMSDFPLLVAAAVGLFQYVPEVMMKRIKLTLHLPVRETPVLYWMVTYGCLLILTIYLLVFGAFYGWMLTRFPAELVVPLVGTLISWCLVGLITYFLIAMVAMEPIWKYRMLYMVITVAVVDMLPRRADLSVGESIPFYLLLMVVALSSPLFSSHRFIKGEN
jgi:hypothetical protein